MTYKLFIDDERFPIGNDWIVVRSTKEAIEVVISRGVPKYISFDHDLAGQDRAIDFVKWFTDYVLDHRIPLDLEFFVHSQNPIGSNNITMDMNALISYSRREFGV